MTSELWRDAVCVITGANGYLGRRLAARLLTQTAVSRIVLFDVTCPVRDPHPLPAQHQTELLARCVKVMGDIRQPKAVAAAFEAALAQADSKSDLVVFHVASYGMSGKEQVADPQKVMAINVQGTQHIIDECRRHSTTTRHVTLVYTSSFNTVFGGDPATPIHNGDEHIPYLPLDKHCDLYSKTKSIAEQLVINANSKTVQTCALRSAVRSVLSVLCAAF